MRLSVVLYSQPACQPCKATKRVLDREGVRYDERPLDGDSRAYVRGLGHASAPVIIVLSESGDVVESWSGLQPDRLKKLSTDVDMVSE